MIIFNALLTVLLIANMLSCDELTNKIMDDKNCLTMDQLKGANMKFVNVNFLKYTLLI